MTTTYSKPAEKSSVKRNLSAKAPSSPSSSGHITTQAHAGFPARLLLPLAPITANSIPSSGKVPAFITNAEKAEWRPLHGWREGVLPTTVIAADKAGANCGLRLGTVVDGKQYLAMDFDNEVRTPDEVRRADLINRVALDELSTRIGQPLWVRHTRPGRAMTLIGIAPDADAGLKRQYHMSHATWGSLGKIELLAFGQQTLIGGIHPFEARLISWSRTDKPDDRRPAPAVAEIPVLRSRDEVEQVILAVQAWLARVGIEFHSSKARQALARGAEPDDQAPPDAALLVHLMQRLPHDERVDRDHYVAIMYACVGCLDAMDALDTEQPGDAERVRDAAVAWASRWPGRNGKTTSHEEELAKWESDWSTRPAEAGWRYLLSEARRLGLMELVQQARIQEAQQEFAELVDLEAYPDASAVPALAAGARL